MGIKDFSDRFKGKAQTMWEIIVFYLMSGITTVVDLAAFALFNYLVFTAFRNVDFHWWLLDYSVANGGLCAMLSMACSFAVSQTVNFFLQRKVTFGASNNVLRSAVMYAVMVVSVFVLVLWLPTVLLEPMTAWLGAAAPMIVKLITQFVSALIQFPINKWVIMKK